jgi:hypothetical protein
MGGGDMPSTDTFERPAVLGDDPKSLYARSYLLIRALVGVIGVLLPTAMFALEGTLLKSGWEVRGSLSAYYHSGARDLFVGALCVTGFLLLTYMAAQRNTWDYWLSTVAGVAVLGVALLPTSRPSSYDGTPACGPGSDPIPPGCTALQQRLGEDLVAGVHFTFAAIFILSLAAICFIFARREERFTQNRRQARFHRICGSVILLGVAWVVVGNLASLEPFSLEPLYVGEVVSVYAFGASWMVKSYDLFKRLFGRVTALLTSGTTAPTPPAEGGV